MITVRCLSSEAPAAKAEVARIMKAFEEARDSCRSGTFEPTIGDDGVLWLNLGEKGYYSLQESHGQQLLLFSPITGARSYCLSLRTALTIAHVSTAVRLRRRTVVL